MMTNVQYCLLTSEALVPTSFQDRNTIRKRDDFWGIIAEREITFSEDVLAATDVVFALANA